MSVRMGMSMDVGMKVWRLGDGVWPKGKKPGSRLQERKLKNEKMKNPWDSKNIFENKIRNQSIFLDFGSELKEMKT